jgi:hypothetical protein
MLPCSWFPSFFSESTAHAPVTLAVSSYFTPGILSSVGMKAWSKVIIVFLNVTGEGNPAVSILLISGLWFPY